MLPHNAHLIDNPAIIQQNSITHGVHMGGIYKHRNGNLYKVLHIACNVEDLTWTVIYEALYKSDVSQIWCRKLEDFLAVITLEDGTQQPRFIYQG